MMEFLKTLFNRGNIKGKSKSSPATMVALAKKYGTPSLAFNNEEFWAAAVIENSGMPIFKPDEIPEEWRVKQFISCFVAELKKKKKMEMK
jgi:hypothetical protein